MATELLRPTAAGDECNIPVNMGCSACPNHFNCVFEVVADDATTYIAQDVDAWARDLYNVADSGVGAGVINWVKVHARCKDSTVGNQTSLKIAVKTVGVAHEGAEIDVAEAWTNYEQQWVNNPQAGGAWTWAQIDAIQIGVNLRRPLSFAGSDIQCTQVWLEVDYTVAGWTGSISGVVNPAKVMGKAVADIATVKGVA